MNSAQLHPIGNVFSPGGVVGNTTDAVAFLRSTGFGEAVQGGDPEERVSVCGLLREIVGNPFHPVSITHAWLTPTVLSLVQTAYDNRILPSGILENSRLAVLADALENTGCDNQDILSHLRSSGPHVRGCFALDAILDKS